ncbi:hypothetical protein STEG23_030133 [Scotinomys teguina]
MAPTFVKETVKRHLLNLVECKGKSEKKSGTRIEFSRRDGNRIHFLYICILIIQQSANKGIQKTSIIVYIFEMFVPNKDLDVISGPVYEKPSDCVL